ncbi:MAG: hypothetical protein EPO65_02740 [Dehalococcoidia bacterium]|nr:MAG: hypothetical protein EPO65_02740 [Dehalococcoidia bacterium]
MKPLGWPIHVVVLTSMVIVLWAGGDYIEQWFGHVARSIAELLLILWYLTAIIGMRPFRPGQNPWRRRKDDDPR